jgi:hypothetical protein
MAGRPRGGVEVSGMVVIAHSRRDRLCRSPPHGPGGALPSAEIGRRSRALQQRRVGCFG